MRAPAVNAKAVVKLTSPSGAALARAATVTCTLVGSIDNGEASAIQHLLKLHRDKWFGLTTKDTCGVGSDVLAASDVPSTAAPGSLWRGL